MDFGIKKGVLRAIRTLERTYGSRSSQAPGLDVSAQNRLSRLPDTRRLYSADDLRSSIGAISSPSIRAALSIEAPSLNAFSVLRTRMTVGATLPNAIRG